MLRLTRWLPLLSLLAVLFMLASPVTGQDTDSAPSSAANSDGQDGGAEAGGDAKEDADDKEAKGIEDQINDVFADVNGALASVMFYPIGGVVPAAVLWLIIGAVVFTIRMGFINLRGFKHAILVTAGKYDNPDDHGEVSHFQALTAALSATVGLGNIAGVAIAIALGGPGAMLWMVAAGLLGMTSKFVECTLGQKYREVRPDGSVMGGAMYYLSNGLRDIGLGGLGKVLAVAFAILCIGGSFGGGCAFQVNQSLEAVKQSVPFLADDGNRWVYGLIMTIAVGVVIIGGIKSIARVAEKIVPVMCGVYVLASLVIIVMNFSKVPAAFGVIFDGAFSPDAAYGGFIGVLVVGFKRAAFSNEAGVGSAAIAHSAAKTEYAVREGIVALLEPFIDTVVICTMTALVIVISGAYAVEFHDVPAPTEDDPNKTKSVPVRLALDDAVIPATDGGDGDVDPPEDVKEMVESIRKDQGATLTSIAMDRQIPYFKYILAVAVTLFAYSTMISWSYYGERCFAWLFGDRASMIYRVLFLLFVFLGSIVSATNVLAFGDLMILGMAFPNIIGLLLLSGVVSRELKEYWGKYKSGEFKQTASGGDSADTDASE